MIYGQEKGAVLILSVCLNNLDNELFQCKRADVFSVYYDTVDDIKN